jgi:hypothetical protein
MDEDKFEEYFDVFEEIFKCEKINTDGGFYHKFNYEERFNKTKELIESIITKEIKE